MDVDESPNAQGVGGHDAGATASPPSAVVPGAAAPAAPAPAPAPVQEKKTPKKKTSELELLLGSAALAASAAIPVILPSAADTLDDLQGMFRNISKIRGCWQLPAAIQFLLQFGYIYGIDDVAPTEEIELALAQPLESAVLADIFVKLLSFLTRRKVSFTDWYGVLCAQAEKFDAEDLVAPKGSPFDHLPPVNKLLLLHALCEWQFEDIDHFRSKIKLEDGEDESDWRVTPLGTDNKWNTYWMFDDFRLYRETWAAQNAVQNGGAAPPTPKKQGKKSAGSKDEDESGWSVACETLDEWRQFPKKFQTSRGSRDAALFKYFTEEIIPVVENGIEERLKYRRKREREGQLLPRKRSTRIQAREIQRMEKEQGSDSESDSRSQRLEARTRRIDKQQDVKQMQQVQNNMREERAREREMRLLQRIYPEADFLSSDHSDPSSPAAHQKSNGGSGGSSTSRKSSTPSKSRESPKSASKTKSPTSSSSSSSASKRRKVGVFEDETVEENWEFACVCGITASNYDDGQRLIACEKCGVWQHLKCNNIKQAQVDSIQFVCIPCQDKHQAAQHPHQQAPQHAVKQQHHHAPKQQQQHSQSQQQPQHQPQLQHAVIKEEQGHVESGALAHGNPLDDEGEAEEEEPYLFACKCGVYGDNINDGRDMIQCENCERWMHVDCQPGLRGADLSKINFYCEVCDKVLKASSDDKGRPHRIRKPSKRTMSDASPPPSRPAPAPRHQQHHHQQQQQQQHAQLIPMAMPIPQPLPVQNNGLPHEFVQLLGARAYASALGSAVGSGPPLMSSSPIPDDSSSVDDSSAIRPLLGHAQRLLQSLPSETNTVSSSSVGTSDDDDNLSEDGDDQDDDDDGSYQFSCQCGIVAKNYYDGSQLVKCVNCGTHMHRDCLGPTAQQLIRGNTDVSSISACPVCTPSLANASA